MSPDNPTASDPLARERAAMHEHFCTFPFFKLMGFELLEIEPLYSKIAMQWRPDLTQPAGIMHGGVLAALIDTGIAHALQFTPEYLRTKEHGGLMVSVDLRVKYLRPLSSGRIVCEARAPRVGRQLTHATAVVTDELGKEVATGDSIYMLVAAEQLRKRST